MDTKNPSPAPPEPTWPTRLDNAFCDGCYSSGGYGEEHWFLFGSDQAVTQFCDSCSNVVWKTCHMLDRTINTYATYAHDENGDWVLTGYGLETGEWITIRDDLNDE